MLLLVILTTLAALTAALWLTVTFAPFLGRGKQAVLIPSLVIANLPNGGWGARYEQSELITWRAYVTPSGLCVARYIDDSALLHTKDYRLVYRGYGLWHDSNSGSPLSAVTLPIWLPVAVFGAYPTLRLIKSLVRRRRRRRNPNNCTNCGYNLTGNVSGVCPECGINIHSAETTKTPQTSDFER